MDAKSVVAMLAVSMLSSLIVKITVGDEFSYFNLFCLTLIIYFCFYYAYYFVKVEFYKNKEMKKLNRLEKEYVDQKDYFSAINVVKQKNEIFKEKAEISKGDQRYYKKMVRLHKNLIEQYEYVDYLTKLKNEIKKHKS